MSEQTTNLVNDDTTDLVDVESADEVTSEPTFSDLTPFMAAKVATVILQASGTLPPGKEIAPQAMYSNKTIERYGTKRTEGGQGIYFRGDSFAKWLTEAKKGVAGGRRVDVNALVSQYMDNIDGVDDESNEDEKDAE